MTNAIPRVTFGQPTDDLKLPLSSEPSALFVSRCGAVGRSSPCNRHVIGAFVVEVRMKHKALVVALLAVLASITVPPAVGAAQVTTATLVGVVTDQTGGALPGATVNVRSMETEITRTLTTDGDGRYRGRPRTGHLRGDGRVEGFQTTRRPDVRLSVGQSLTLNVTSASARSRTSSRSPASRRLSTRPARRSPRSSTRSRFASCRSTAATSAS